MIVYEKDACVMGEDKQFRPSDQSEVIAEMLRALFQMARISQRSINSHPR